VCEKERERERHGACQGVSECVDIHPVRKYCHLCVCVFACVCERDSVWVCVPTPSMDVLSFVCVCVCA